MSPLARAERTGRQSESWLQVTIYHGKLHHQTPGWVSAGSRFHIRIRLGSGGKSLTHPDVAPQLLDSASLYHRLKRWYAWLFLLMPDHIHAVLSFPIEESMSRVIGHWKKYHNRTLKVVWLDGYFDHRLRNDEEFAEKCRYIRMNPVCKSLCSNPGDWQWLCEPWKGDIRE